MVCVRPIDGRPASVRLSGTWARQAEEFVSLRSAYRSGSTPFASSHRSGPIYWSVSADLGPLDLWNLHRSLPSGKGQLRSVCSISICLDSVFGVRQCVGRQRVAGFHLCTVAPTRREMCPIGQAKRSRQHLFPPHDSMLGACWVGACCRHQFFSHLKTEC
jgi:hypothetical protein